MMTKYDSKYYAEYISTNKSTLKEIREDWKSYRDDALRKLNKELNDSGKPGHLFNIDVSDDELYPYVSDINKHLFFRYYRILDFSDGYKPKDIFVIKKGLEK